MSNLKIDFSKPNGGRIRPLHGVNSGPATKAFTFDAGALFAEAGIPSARLHDVEYPYGSGEFVDIPCIFKNFDADETLESNYNFALTDEYIRAIINVGCQPLFRLGVSIEHAPVKRYIYPPRDYMKWSRICEHIIRHYNEGWANGFHWNIKYWEIWCEADGSGNLWLGTPEEFYELYCVSACHLKKCFPDLKIGGCAFTREENAFIDGFFDYITAKPERIPLDFYSWHRYFTSIDSLMKSCNNSKTLLEKYGYTDAENVLDEWNYMQDWRDQAESYVNIKNHIGAAYCGAVLSTLQQKTDIDSANYFEADVVKEWCGLFEISAMAIGRHQRATIGPLKPFYAFKAFNELYKLGAAVNAEADDTLSACAATDGSKIAALAVNYSDNDQTVTFELSGLPADTVEIRLTDSTHTFEKILEFKAGSQLDFTLKLKNNSFVYLGSPIA